MGRKHTHTVSIYTKLLIRLTDNVYRVSFSKSLLEKPEEGSYVHSRGVAKCIRYNVKRLWSGGYNLSGSELNLWINTHRVFLF